MGASKLLSGCIQAFPTESSLLSGNGSRTELLLPPSGGRLRTPTPVSSPSPSSRRLATGSAHNNVAAHVSSANQLATMSKYAPTSLMTTCHTCAETGPRGNVAKNDCGHATAISAAASTAGHQRQLSQTRRRRLNGRRLNPTAAELASGSKRP